MTSLTVKEQGKPLRRVTFKNDNPALLMKPPCDTRIFELDASPISVSTNVETEQTPPLRGSSNAWRPKRRGPCPLRHMTPVIPTDGELLQRKHANQFKCTQSDIL